MLLSGLGLGSLGSEILNSLHQAVWVALEKEGGKGKKKRKRNAEEENKGQ